MLTAPAKSIHSQLRAQPLLQPLEICNKADKTGSDTLSLIAQTGLQNEKL